MFLPWNIIASMYNSFIEKLIISLVFLLFIINSSLSFSQHILDGINNSPQLIQNYSYNLENQLIGYDLTGYSGVTAPDFSFVAEYNGTDGIDGLGRLVLAEEDIGQVGGGSAAYLWSHTYDERSQLTATVRIKDLSGYWNQTFTYDLNGNLLKQQEYSQSAQTFDHAGDVLTQVDAQALDSDDNGQMQETLSATDVDWNWEGKIRSVTRPDGTVISYKYDDMGNRIYKKVDDGQSTTETIFLWMTPGDLPVLLAEVDAATDNILRSYIHVNTQPVVLFDGDMTDSLTDKYFYLSDRLGSVRLIVDESAGVSHHYAYKPFGQTDSAESDSGQAAPYNPLMFTGQYYDIDPNMYYLRARHYAPELFGFLSFDPVRGFEDRPLTLNRYLYTINNPINYYDPSGQFFGDLLFNAGVRTSMMSSSFIAMTGGGLASEFALFLTLSGMVQSAYIFATGEDMITGEKADFLDYAFAGVDFLPFGSFITQPLKKAGKGGKDYLRRAARSLFVKANIDVSGRQVHHDLPLEWSHIFPELNPNRKSNLIAYSRTVHEEINEVWRVFKQKLDGRAPTKMEVTAQMLEVEEQFGHLGKRLE